MATDPEESDFLQKRNVLTDGSIWIGAILSLLVWTAIAHWVFG